MVKVLLFASAREIVGEPYIDLEVELGNKLTCKELLDAICQQFPVLGSSRDSLSVAVNRKYLRGSDTFEININDEIALIPPISGG